jgi:two-component system LytT family response regulator
MKLRYMIIDDEYLARQRLLKLLEQTEDMIFVGECRNGQEALIKIPIKEPDLIFLDIQMPDLNGFEVLSKLNIKPQVIFTTAYDSYALKAFDINAVDYLLKPFGEDRLQESLKRIFELKQQKGASQLESKLKALIKDYRGDTSNYLQNINFKERGKHYSVSVDDIIYFKSDGNYVKLVTERKKHLYRITMNMLNNELDREQFIRIHRAIIINKFYIKKCVYNTNNEYKFYLKNGELVESSRSYSKDISEYMSS